MGQGWDKGTGTASQFTFSILHQYISLTKVMIFKLYTCLLQLCALSVLRLLNRKNQPVESRGYNNENI